jgi:hypothetical protein
MIERIPLIRHSKANGIKTGRNRHLNRRKTKPINEKNKPHTNGTEFFLIDRGRDLDKMENKAKRT